MIPSCIVRSGGGQAAADDQLARRAQDPEWAPGHAELAVVDECGCLDLELAVDLAHCCLDVERHLPAGRVQLAARAQSPLVQGDGPGDEADAGMVGDVEELARAQVCVALAVLGLEAVGVDRELERWALVEVEGALVAVEVPLDGHQAVEVRNVELDARAGRVEMPITGCDVRCVRDVGDGGGGDGGDGAHCCPFGGGQLLMAGAVRMKRASSSWSSRKAAMSARVIEAPSLSRPRKPARTRPFAGPFVGRVKRAIVQSRSLSITSCDFASSSR